MGFPAVLQAAKTECGLGVGASVLQHYGRYQTISDLRLIAEPVVKASRCAKCATSSSRKVWRSKPSGRPLSNTFEILASRFILHWNNSHYVVLVRIRKDRVHIGPLHGNEGDGPSGG